MSTSNQDPSQLVDELYEKYNKEGTYNLHTVLWQIIVNEARNIEAKSSAFYYDGTQLILTDKGAKGYTGTPCICKNSDEAKALAEGLNIDLFGLDPDTHEAEIIISSTMF